MNFKLTTIVLTSISLFLLLIFRLPIPVKAGLPAQMPTSSIPTVTGTPVGALITVKSDQEQINVRSGPGTYYPKVGVLLAGQQVPAKGRSAGGDWILVEYPGVPGSLAWLYAPLVDLSPGSQLSVVEPPPTPTPLYTATINPTLAAQFIITSIPTRLPTFTPPPPLVITTFQDVSGSSSSRNIPSGMVIIGLLSFGALLGVISITQRQ